jgi:hypothetical protein
VRHGIVLLMVLAGILAAPADLLARAKPEANWPEPEKEDLRITFQTDKLDSLRAEVREPRGRVWSYDRGVIATDIPGSNRSGPLVFRGGRVDFKAFVVDGPVHGTYRIRVDAVTPIRVTLSVWSGVKRWPMQYTEPQNLNSGEVRVWTLKWTGRPGQDGCPFSLRPRVRFEYR